MSLELLLPLLAAAVQSGTPILYATLGEIFTEKSGILNLGVEGIMMIGALAAFAGGTAHGFKLYLGPINHAVVWNVTVISIGLATLLMLIAGIRSARHPTTPDREKRHRGHRWLKGGILVTAVGLLIQQSGWSIHEHFNHNDIYHLVQMVGIYFFYRGALLLHDL